VITGAFPNTYDNCAGKLSRVPVQSVQGDFILIRLERMYSLSFDYLILLESLEVSKFVGQLVRGAVKIIGYEIKSATLGRSKTTPDISTYAPAASGLGETASLTNAWSLFNPPIVSFPRSTLIALRPRFDSERKSPKACACFRMLNV
jgi:hypothetical protein